jgi:hypothetical protein
VLFDLVGKERDSRGSGRQVSGPDSAIDREAKSARRSPRNRQKLLENLPQNETIED